MDHRVDSLGDICPIPIIKAERKLKEIAVTDRIILETDHSCSSSSVVNHFKMKYSYPVELVEIENGIWEIIIVKSS